MESFPPIDNPTFLEHLDQKIDILNEGFFCETMDWKCFQKKFKSKNFRKYLVIFLHLNQLFSTCEMMFSPSSFANLPFRSIPLCSISARAALRCQPWNSNVSPQKTTSYNFFIKMSTRSFLLAKHQSAALSSLRALPSDASGMELPKNCFSRQLKPKFCRHCRLRLFKNVSSDILNCIFAEQLSNAVFALKFVIVHNPNLPEVLFKFICHDFQSIVFSTKVLSQSFFL